MCMIVIFSILFQAILTLLYFTLKSVFTKRDNSSDSGISGSWKSSLSDDEMMNEKQPLLSGVKKGQTENLIYTNEKEIYNNMRSLYYVSIFKLDYLC